MNCQECKTGEVQVVSVRRYSPALVRLGAALWVLALAGAIAAPVVAYAHRVPVPAPIDPIAVAKQTAVAKLKQLDGVPADLVTEFEKTNLVSDDDLGLLKTALQDEVALIVSDYEDVVRNPKQPPPPPEWWTNRWMWVALVLSLAACVGGGVVRGRTQIERCDKCGALFHGDDWSMY